MQNRISVTIAGQKYTVLAQESEEYTRQVAQRADKKIAEAKSFTEASSLNAAVLAALNLADEATKAEREAARTRGELDEFSAQTEAMRDEILRLEQENIALKEEVLKLRKGRKESHATA